MNETQQIVTIDPGMPCIRAFGRLIVDLRFFVAFVSAKGGGFLKLSVANKIEEITVDEETAAALRAFFLGENEEAKK